jgi:hypothetical protein
VVSSFNDFMTYASEFRSFCVKSGDISHVFVGST